MYEVQLMDNIEKQNINTKLLQEKIDANLLMEVLK